MLMAVVVSMLVNTGAMESGVDGWRCTKEVIPEIKLTEWDSKQKKKTKRRRENAKMRLFNWAIEKAFSWVDLSVDVWWMN